MQKLLVICGPTATGKTSLAISLAQKFGGEVINADSRQVYKGMDIVTGKDIPLNVENRRMKDGIPVWLLDIADPDYIFNAGEYKILAEKVIKDIESRKKLPIICGGTGLYIKSITAALDLLSIPPNDSLRNELSGKSVQELIEILRKIDKQRSEQMNQSDSHNPRRLIRAIETSMFMKKNKIKIRKTKEEEKKDVLFIGLKTSKMEDLYSRIDRRVDERMEIGAIKEAENLLSKRYDSKLPSLSASGYKYLFAYLEKKIPLEKAVADWKRDEQDYARRQMTWFGKEKRICWFDVTKKDYQKEVVEKVSKWYTENNEYAFQD